VAAFYNVGLLDLRSQRRTQPVTFYRQVAMYLAKELTTHSLPAIGRQFGGRDHTTVLHAWRKIAPLRADPDFDTQMRGLISLIMAGGPEPHAAACEETREATSEAS
jgi:chromosomal replication initiator protein